MYWRFSVVLHTLCYYIFFGMMSKKIIIRYGIVSILCLVIFFANNLWFKKLDISYNYPFIRNHLNDTLATIFLLSCFTFVKSLRKHNVRISFVKILLICSLASILWEYAAIWLKPGSTFDYIDILCYFLGGLIYYFSSKI